MSFFNDQNESNSDQQNENEYVVNFQIIQTSKLLFQNELQIKNKKIRCYLYEEITKEIFLN